MIRNVCVDDYEAIMEIYNDYVVNTTVSFETEPLTLAEMSTRIESVAVHYPCFVCEENGRVMGFCYVHAWKERAAYSATLETTIYLRQEAQHGGLGRRMMQLLIDECRKRGYNALIACITAENHISRAFHESLGFHKVSMFEGVGVKFGRRLDVTDYELVLRS